MRMFQKTATSLIICTALCAPLSAMALGISSSSAKSALYEPLRAVVHLSLNPGEDLGAASFRIANQEGHAKAGISYPNNASDLHVHLTRSGGSAYLFITSKKHIYDPTLKLAIEANLPKGGTILLPVTILLDTQFARPLDSTNLVPAVPTAPAVKPSVQTKPAKPVNQQPAKPVAKPVTKPAPAPAKPAPAPAPKPQTEPTAKPVPAPVPAAPVAKPAPAPTPAPAPVAPSPVAPTPLPVPPVEPTPPVDPTPKGEMPKFSWEKDAAAKPAPAAPAPTPAPVAPAPAAEPAEPKAATPADQPMKVRPVAPVDQTAPASFLDSYLLPSAGIGAALLALIGFVMLRRKKQNGAGDEHANTAATHEPENAFEYEGKSTQDNTQFGIDDDANASHHTHSDDHEPKFDGEPLDMNASDPNSFQTDNVGDDLLDVLNSQSQNPLEQAQVQAMEEEIFANDDDHFTSRMARVAQSIPVMDEDVLSVKNKDLNESVTNRVVSETILENPDSLVLPEVSTSDENRTMEFSSFNFNSNAQTDSAQQGHSEQAEPVMTFDFNLNVPEVQVSEPTLDLPPEPVLNFDMNEPQSAPATNEFNLETFDFDQISKKALAVGERSNMVEAASHFAIDATVPSDGNGRLQLELACLYAQNQDWDGAKSSLREVLSEPTYAAFHREAQRLLSLIPKNK